MIEGAVLPSESPPALLPPSRAREAIAAADMWMGKLAHIAATAGALTILGVALVATFDVVVMRWILNAQISGSNEIFQTVFPTAIALVLAAGLCSRATLEVDLLGAFLSARTVRWLRAIGAVVFLFTIIVIAFAVYKQAMLAYNRGTETMIMGWQLSPWYIAIAVAFAVCIPAQFLVALRATAELHPNWFEGTILVFGGAVLVSLALIYALQAGQMFFLSNMLATALILIALLWMMILLFVPVAAALSVTACLGILALFGHDQMINIAGNETIGLLIKPDLSVLPFFLLMGGFAIQSGMSRDIFAFAQAIFAPFRGGLALATIGGAAGFGALTGSSVATVGTIGATAYPEMKQRGYSEMLSAGSIVSGGTLGQLIPPSTAAVVYALLVEQSVGVIYIAMIVPALLTIVFYLAAIGITVAVAPATAPRGETWNFAEIGRTGVKSFPAVLVFGMVFGGIFLGIFTATEAAGVGAVVTFAMLIVRGGLREGAFWRVMAETTRSTSMIYFLIIGAMITTFFFSSTGLTSFATAAITGSDLPGWSVVVLLCVAFVLLGTVLDSMAVMMVTASLTAGIVTALGYDAIWWAVIMIIVVEIGVVTPPFGVNLFMLKGVAPSISLKNIYVGVIPFVVADLIKLGLLIAFPIIVMWLPGLIK